MALFDFIDLTRIVGIILRFTLIMDKSIAWAIREGCWVITI